MTSQGFPLNFRPESVRLTLWIQQNCAYCWSLLSAFCFSQPVALWSLLPRKTAPLSAGKSVAQAITIAIGPAFMSAGWITHFLLAIDLDPLCFELG